MAATAGFRRKPSIPWFSSSSGCRMAVAAFRLMIIESDPYLRDLYASGIRTRFPDLKIESVGNGIEGLIAIGRCEPDILILDLVMPGVDGFRLLHTLKTNEIYEKIAIIIVTGLSDDVIESNGGLPEHICLLKNRSGSRSFRLPSIMP